MSYVTSTYVSSIPEGARSLPVLQVNIALGPTLLLSQWALDFFTLVARWPGSEADHSSPSKAEVKHEWINISTPFIFCAFMACTGSTVLRKCEVVYTGKVHIVCRTEDKLISFTSNPFSRTETTFYGYLNPSGLYRVGCFATRRFVFLSDTAI